MVSFKMHQCNVWPLSTLKFKGQCMFKKNQKILTRATVILANLDLKCIENIVMTHLMKKIRLQKHAVQFIMMQMFLYWFKHRYNWIWIIEYIFFFLLYKHKFQQHGPLADSNFRFLLRTRINSTTNIKNTKYHIKYKHVSTIIFFDDRFFVTIFDHSFPFFGSFGRSMKPHGTLEPSERHFMVSGRFEFSFRFWFGPRLLRQ